MFDMKYRRVIFAFFMSLFMSFIMSMVITFINLGFVDDFVIRWMEAFFKAYVCAFPIVFFVAPAVQRITNKLIKEENL
ncbi:hypothetical protein CP965_12800 [Halarcobacter mediterraneus]|uniref:DUF2798 domain-containing protein n=1 Tax=Halarcobacter mediterraneus TaxID=2023153 RepID=A0A4V1M100_9BACT|nr:DUF2798 domain-containing protein [Halarcobacter mediterraneus]RXK11644.1 hypothetical protein CP965_12800 [Halarcobacter mediterraneus]